VTVASLVKPYYALMCCIAGMITLYVLFIKADLWKKVALLTFAALLFPHVSADYKLIHLFLPLVLFINAPGGFRHDKLFTWFFGLLLIPKSYHYFQNIVSDSSTHDISIAVPINIVIMTGMMTSLLAEGLSTQKGKAWVSDWKLTFSDYLGMAKQYRVQLVALALIGCAMLFYMKFGMTEYKEVARNLRQSQALCNEGRYSEALDICNKLISKSQGGADSYYIASTAGLGLRQWEDAARSAEMALTLAPDYRAAAQNLNSARTALTGGPKKTP
jgi:tetratricopeptide (TPR) repeat protein